MFILQFESTGEEWKEIELWALRGTTSEGHYVFVCAQYRVVELKVLYNLWVVCFSQSSYMCFL